MYKQVFKEVTIDHPPFYMLLTYKLAKLSKKVASIQDESDLKGLNIAKNHLNEARDFLKKSKKAGERLEMDHPFQDSLDKLAEQIDSLKARITARLLLNELDDQLKIVDVTFNTEKKFEFLLQAIDIGTRAILCANIAQEFILNAQISSKIGQIYYKRLHQVDQEDQVRL